MRLPLVDIRLDGGTQSRAALSESQVAEYTDLYLSGIIFPELVVFHDGANHWLADGFHRWHGATKAGLAHVECDVRQGGQRDAILYSVGANDKHGLRRTNADKRRAVEMLLRDEEWGARSDRWIAERCGVGYSLVAEMRKQLPESGSSSPRTGQDGKERRMPTPRPTPKPKLTPIEEDTVADRAESPNVRTPDPSTEPSIPSTVSAPASEPARRRVADRDDKVRELHERGLGAGAIANELGVSRNSVHGSLRYLGLNAASLEAKESPLARLVEDAATIADSWKMCASSPKHEWLKASVEQQQELALAVDAAIKAMQSTIRRLNKEAKRNNRDQIPED